MNLTRRDVLRAGAGASASLALGIKTVVAQNTALIERANLAVNGLAPEEDTLKATSSPGRAESRSAYPRRGGLPGSSIITVFSKLSAAA